MPSKSSKKSVFLLFFLILLSLILLLSLKKKYYYSHESNTTPISLQEPNQLSTLEFDDYKNTYLRSNFEAPFKNHFISFEVTKDKKLELQLIAFPTDEQLKTAKNPEEYAALQKANYKSTLWHGGNSTFWAVGKGRKINDRYVIVMSTQKKFTILDCQINANLEQIQCNKPQELNEYSGMEHFAISAQGNTILVESKTSGSLSSFTLISSNTLTKEIITVPTTKFNFYEGEIFPLRNERHFSYWSYHPEINKRVISVYENGKFRQIEGVPSKVTWGDYEYSIDYYNEIALSDNDEVCFNYTVSGGSGIILIKNGVSFQDPQGEKECPSRFSY